MYIEYKTSNYIKIRLTVLWCLYWYKYDLWIGLYIDPARKMLYIGLLPTIGLRYFYGGK